MAVILKKKREGVQERSIAQASRLADNKRLILGGIVLLSAVFLGLGYLSADPAPPVQKKAAVEAKKPVTLTPQEEIQALGSEAAKLTAALLAFKKEQGALPLALTELAPAYTPVDFSDKNAPWQFWGLQDAALVRKDISKETCLELTPSKVLTHLDYGHRGLRCVMNAGAEGKAESYSAVYRIDEQLPLKGFWKVTLTGEYDDKLTTWSVRAAEKLESQCAGNAKIDHQAKLDRNLSKVSVEFCLPAYANEVRELHHGLSLLEGSDATTVDLALMEAPMKLHLAASTCNFGQVAMLQAKLFGHQDKVPVTPNISCDLKR